MIRHWHDPRSVASGPGPQVLSTLGVAIEQGEQAGRGRVHPVESTHSPTAGLVEVHNRCLMKQVPGDVEERLRGLCCFGDHLGQGPDRDRCAEDVGEQLGHPVEGQVLMNGQVGSQGPDPRSVTGRGVGHRGDGGFGGGATLATPSFSDMFGDDQSDLGELEDLAVFDVDHVGIVQARAARRA
jgi:hypothetical protein